MLSSVVMWGGAWGFKLDALDKLDAVKSTDNKHHLVHFLVTQVAKNAQGLQRFGEAMTEVLGPATDVSLQELRTDLTALQRSLDLVGREKDQATGAEAERFSNRMGLFLTTAEARLTVLTSQFDGLDEVFERVSGRYGWKAKKGEDGVRDLVQLLARFAKKFTKAQEDNRKEAERAEKERKRAEAAAARKAAKRDGSKEGGGGGGGDKDDDVFGKFNKSTLKGNAAEIMATFRRCVVRPRSPS